MTLEFGHHPLAENSTHTVVTAVGNEQEPIHTGKRIVKGVILMANGWKFLKTITVALAVKNCGKTFLQDQIEDIKMYGPRII